MTKGQCSANKQDWESLRDRCRSVLVSGPLDAFVYASALAEKRRMSYIDALEIASERIEILSKEIAKKYDPFDPANEENREEEYFKRLLRMMKSAD